MELWQPDHNNSVFYDAGSNWNKCLSMFFTSLRLNGFALRTFKKFEKKGNRKNVYHLPSRF